MSSTRALLAALRRGQPIGEASLQAFAQGLADGSVSDAQAGAFAMGVVLSKLTHEDSVALTLAMRDSGDVTEWDLPAPVIDKHSTGGIGDCVSLLLAPALAACGGYVPMVSGRGLGHTGGTLDKLESIPGFKTALSMSRFRQTVRDNGLAIVSASPTLAPADKRLYAIRDVTSTVESLDLITASILSKKLAAGLEALVLDVKCGSGAFMKTADEARALAQSLVSTANAAGCKTSALITDMSQPLVPSLGNALEVSEVMHTLTTGQQSRLLEITAALGGQLLSDAALAENPDNGAAKIATAITSGQAAEAFARMIRAQGGPLGFVENWSRFLPEANIIREVKAPKSGHISSYDGEALGLAVVALGGGRQVETDSIDHAVGLSDLLPLGTRVQKGEPIARIHASRESAALEAERAVLKAAHIGTAPAAQPLILERLV
ncbi:thymidine phosphorylase [Lentibacter sp. XHP0401]|uniref:thymidine phosphorylase n=1 Tax=Lentibacter sp. XHP0401 TaxID=2984334 RepID=UPI0021E84AD4|nr:thymidine phosphorylase [Lentibacter sp. XHP0401]MCV2893246.1 thymidine phosphorylase [Lentibacter sp. XHP0401]